MATSEVPVIGNKWRRSKYKKKILEGNERERTLPPPRGFCVDKRCPKARDERWKWKRKEREEEREGRVMIRTNRSFHLVSQL